MISKASLNGNIAIYASFDCQCYVERRPFYHISTDRTVLETFTVFWGERFRETATGCSLEESRVTLTTNSTDVSFEENCSLLTSEVWWQSEACCALLLRDDIALTTKCTKMMYHRLIAYMLMTIELVFKSFFIRFWKGKFVLKIFVVVL